MMSLKTKNGRPARLAGIFAACGLAAFSLPLSAAWQVVANEQGKRIEIERNSVAASGQNGATALGRVVLDKPIVDPRTTTSYQTIEILNRYDCKERTYATLKRTYYKEDGELLRQEDVKVPNDMPVRSGTPDDKLFREACRPKGAAEAGKVTAGETIGKVNEMAAELRQHNEALIDKAVKKDVQRLAAQARETLAGKRRVATASSAGSARARGNKVPAVEPVRLAWSYEGNSGPMFWGRLNSDYQLCASGRRQSPIDLREGFAVDLEPIRFDYLPASFRVADSGRNLVVFSYGGSLSLLGKPYALTQFQFYRPSETAVDGRHFDMEVQLTHRAADGKVVILSVLLEKGGENPFIQRVLNNLPLERGGELAPPEQRLDTERLLPADRRYYTFMGSLTTPPCTEDVQWLVLKQPQAISPEQLNIFERLYPPNARPLQPGFGRIIKESR